MAKAAIPKKFPDGMRLRGKVFRGFTGLAQTVCRMFHMTGLRRDELVGLLFDDIEFERQTLIIPAH